MNRLFTTLLLVTTLFSTVTADSSFLNGQCTGLDVITNSFLEEGEYHCTNAKSLKLDPKKCAPPINGACPPRTFFYTKAPIDNGTKLPDLCCSLMANINLSITDYIERTTEEPYCSIGKGYVSALRSAVEFQSVYPNNTVSNSTLVYQCQFIQLDNVETDLPNPETLEKSDSFIFGFGARYEYIYQGTENVWTVSDEQEQCKVVYSSETELLCPDNMWLKANLDRNSQLCCHAEWTIQPKTFAKRGALIQKEINNINGYSYCDYGTFLIGQRFFDQSSDNLVCAAIETSSSPTVTTVTSTITATSTFVASDTCVSTNQP